jgi:hypothetical protein
MSNDQINLASEAARETVSSLISAALKTKGSYKKYTEYELDEQKARKYWVCGVCNKSTFEVEDEYLVHPKLHLGCALKEESKGKDIKEQYIDACEPTGGDRREKNWLQKKHEDKVFGKPGKWREDIQNHWPYDEKGNLLPNVTTTRKL